VGSYACIALVPATHMALGALVSGSRVRRYGAVAAAAIALAVPLLFPPEPRWLRAAAALSLAMALFRTIDLAKERTERPIFSRILHVAVPFDTRRIHRGGSPPSLGEVARAAGWALAAATAMAIVVAVGPMSFERPAALGARWLAGALLAYAATDFAYGSIRAALRGAGFHVYEFHRTPAAALSVKEFWGERWNRTVMAWFREHIVRPFAKRGRTGAGLVASFAASAALHAYLVVVSVGGVMALVMGGYFVVQAALIGVERAIGIRGRLARRAWTITVMILTSPLFVEPGLRVLAL
jgi:hypothetical protein